MLTNSFFPDSTFVDFCDRDANWGPLLFLRPARNERLSLWRTGVGALLLGAPFGLLATIVLTLVARGFEVAGPSLFVFPLLLTAGYWLIAQLTLARAWNRRSARLMRWG
jgi:hypothetical protein